MKLTIEIPDYDRKKGFQYKFVDGYEIEVKKESDGGIIITANKEGLEFLAAILLNLAQDDVPDFCHIHLSQFDALEDGSIELTIQQKMDKFSH